MCRRERPQKGRYRQFHQVDVEVFGVTSPSVDVEVIEMALAYIEGCGLTQYELILNSVGDATCRPAYVETLRAALRAQASRLCGDCQRRTETNPLRVLDCKVPDDQAVIEGAAEDLGPPLRRVPRPLRGGAPRAGAPEDPVSPEPSPGARPRLLRAHDLRGA